MQQKRLAYGLMAALAGLASAEDVASDVATLTQDTFADFVKANDLVLAECKSFPPMRICQPDGSLTCCI